jgi:hypothetical protein
MSKNSTNTRRTKSETPTIAISCSENSFKEWCEIAADVNIKVNHIPLSDTDDYLQSLWQKYGKSNK